ncbi:MAG: hypothetical protein K2H07_02745, partial [Lachnospiraceae bacterium]|nr:hypothetical protein [Lachnospiraceae bacterium]
MAKSNSSKNGESGKKVATNPEVKDSAAEDVEVTAETPVEEGTDVQIDEVEEVSADDPEKAMEA